MSTGELSHLNLTDAARRLLLAGLVEYGGPAAAGGAIVRSSGPKARTLSSISPIGWLRRSRVISRYLISIGRAP